MKKKKKNTQGEENAHCVCECAPQGRVRRVLEWNTTERKMRENRSTHKGNPIFESLFLLARCLPLHTHFVLSFRLFANLMGGGCPVKKKPRPFVGPLLELYVLSVSPQKCVLLLFDVAMLLSANMYI